MSPDAPPPAARHPSTLVLALGASVAAAGAIAYHRTLLYFFSQDDFASLARAAGMAPRLHGPWRYLGNQAIFDLLRPMADLHPMPYHLARLGAGPAPLRRRAAERAAPGSRNDRAWSHLRHLPRLLRELGILHLLRAGRGIDAGNGLRVRRLRRGDRFAPVGQLPELRRLDGE